MSIRSYTSSSPSSGAAIGSLVTGGTQGSVLFVGAAGVLAQNNTAFKWDDNTKFTVTTTSEASGITAAGAMGLSFNGLLDGSYSSGLVIASTNAAAFFPVHLVLKNAAYNTEGLIFTANSHGLNFAGPRSGAGPATFTFLHNTSGSPFRAAFSTDTSIPAFQLVPGGAAQVCQQVQLASSQTADAIQVMASDGTTKLWNVGATGFMETIEITAPSAPSANGVRIYAQDNGAGKTQLMARFASGAAQQIAIEP